MKLRRDPTFDLAILSWADFGYDPDGRQTYDEHDGNPIQFSYDAAGRMEKTWRSYDNAYETMMYQDGVGAEVKRRQRTWDSQANNWGAWESVYFINSTVLGRVITETTTAPESTQKRDRVNGTGSDLHYCNTKL